MGIVKINLGSGIFKLGGWLNVDLDPTHRPDIVADLSRPFPFGNGSADFMHCEDFIDQLELEAGRRFLTECHRVLKPGGALRVLTPDVEKLARLYLESPQALIGLWTTYVGMPLQLNTAAEVLNLSMREGGHTFLYDTSTLHQLAGDCGFTAERASYRESRFPELRDTDLRDPARSVSMYHDLVRNP